MGDQVDGVRIHPLKSRERFSPDVNPDGFEGVTRETNLEILAMEAAGKNVWQVLTTNNGRVWGLLVDRLIG